MKNKKIVRFEFHNFGFCSFGNFHHTANLINFKCCYSSFQEIHKHIAILLLSEKSEGHTFTKSIQHTSSRHSHCNINKNNNNFLTSTTRFRHSQKLMTNKLFFFVFLGLSFWVEIPFCQEDLLSAGQNAREEDVAKGGYTAHHHTRPNASLDFMNAF